jgi:hypothetical protein
MIRLASVEGGKVVHLVRWAGAAQWRAECNRFDFGWRDSQEVAEPNRWGSTTARPATFDTLGRPICLDCLRRVEADRRQVEAWVAEAPR